MRRVRCIFGAAGIAALAAGGLFAAPATAAPPVVTVTSPGDGALLAGQPRVTGQAQRQGGGQVLYADIVVTPREAREGHGPQVTRVSGNGGPTLPFDVGFQFAYNGTYAVAVTATGCGTPCALTTETSAPVTREFHLVIPPAPPGGLKATADRGARSVDLTWQANAEPDLLGYIVQRATATGRFDDIGETEAETSYTDELAPGDSAGSYRYRVIAVRSGASGTARPAVQSDPSGAVTIRINSGPSASTTTSTTASTPGSGNSATTSPRRQSGPAASQSRNRSRPGGLRSLVGPDGQPLNRSGGGGDLDYGAFDQQLPYTEQEPGQDQVFLEDAGRPAGPPEDDKPTGLLFLAGGLLTATVGGHLLWLRRQVAAAPLDPVPPEVPGPPP